MAELPEKYFSQGRHFDSELVYVLIKANNLQLEK